DQADGGQHRGHRIGLDGVAQVAEELTTTALDVSQRRIDEFAGRQFAFQRMDDIADVGSLLLDLALQLCGIFLRFHISLVACTHDVCPLTASLSFCMEWRVRSGLNEDASNFFLPAETMTSPITTTTPPTISAASQGAMISLRPYTADISRTIKPPSSTAPPVATLAAPALVARMDSLSSALASASSLVIRSGTSWVSCRRSPPTEPS